MEILKTGEKIKKLRKELGLKQNDLTNEEVTKSLISMIENNKRSLSWKTARIITDCLNQYYSNIGRTITAEYLMETEEEQARNIIRDQIKVVESSLYGKTANHLHLHQSIEWMMELAEKWQTKKETTDLLKLRGEVYYYNYQYNEALKDYSDALEYYLSGNNLKEVATLYHLIGLCYQMQGLIELALMYYRKSIDINSDTMAPNKATMKPATIQNIITCYCKLGKYDMVFQNIKLFKDLASYDDPIYDEVTLMEANAYRDLKNYDKAEKNYKKLLRRSKRLDSSTLFSLYDNYITLCREQGKLEKVAYVIDEALKMKGRIEPVHLLDLFQEKVKYFLYYNQHDEAMGIMKKAAVIADQITEIEKKIDFYFSFAEMNMILKKYDRAEDYLCKAEELISDYTLEKKNSQLHSRYAELFNLIGQYEKSLHYIILLQSNRISP